MATNITVSDDQYQKLDRIMRRIKLQLDQRGGINLHTEFDFQILCDIWDECEVCDSKSKFSIGKAVELGTGLQNSAEFLEALSNPIFKMSESAKDIIEKPEFLPGISQIDIRIDIGVATTKEIIGRSGTLDEIYEGIYKIGGELFLAEAGPQWRLQYVDQPIGETLLMAMKPIKDSEGKLCLFSVERLGRGLWLNVRSCENNSSVWDSNFRWAFALAPFII